jgi:AraC-like DNA-binding protein
MLLEQTSTDVILFLMLYGGVAAVALICCIYLCLRKSNAFAPDITPPVRLRHWAAAFYAVGFLGHIWWYLFYIFSRDTTSISYLVVIILDCVGMLTTIAGTLFAMLQDRKRPIWPIAIAMIPFVVLGILHLVNPDSHFMDIAIAYVLSLYLILTIYMVFAVRKYERWLRDNYADLEHKEVWLSHTLIIGLLLLMITYGFDSGDIIISYLVQFIGFLLAGILLWRVETLPQLEDTSMEPTCNKAVPETAQESEISTQAQQTLGIPTNIEQLLAERCVDSQLYLQHDLTLLQLAQAIGTNRYYLSQYFSRQGITYNAYINNLRINHFMNLYREAIAAQQPVIAQHLASDSGYRSYSTFSLAFKQRIGQTVTAWMRNTEK